MAKRESTPTTATKTTTAPTAPKADNATLLTRIGELTQETLDHPQVVNKTDQGVASRVARFLNKEGIHKCAAHRFWTGAHVLAIVAKLAK
jgi:hypothetical protein